MTQLHQKHWWNYGLNKLDASSLHRGVHQTYIKMELVCPVANFFVFRRLVPSLVLIDLVAAWSISVLIEEHRIASNT